MFFMLTLQALFKMGQRPAVTFTNLYDLNLPCWRQGFASVLMTLDIDPAGDPWLPCPGFFGFLLRVWIPSFFILSGRFTCKAEQQSHYLSYFSAKSCRDTKFWSSSNDNPNIYPVLYAFLWVNSLSWNHDI